MATDDRDRQEVDRLVRELSAPKPPVVPKVVVPEPAVSQASALPPTHERPIRPSRWTTARILMPAMRAAEPRKSLASRLNLPALPVLELPPLPALRLPSLSALRLPSLPALRLPSLPAFRMPALAEAASPRLVVRAWVALALVLSVSMPYWPYPKTYLVGLLLYLFAVAVLVVAGVWSAKLTWDVRLGGAHTVSIGIVLWAIALVAAETIPRVGGGS